MDLHASPRMAALKAVKECFRAMDSQVELAEGKVGFLLSCLITCSAGSKTSGLTICWPMRLNTLDNLQQRLQVSKQQSIKSNNTLSNDFLQVKHSARDWSANGSNCALPLVQVSYKVIWNTKLLTNSQASTLLKVWERDTGRVLWGLLICLLSTDALPSAKASCPDTITR